MSLGDAIAAQMILAAIEQIKDIDEKQDEILEKLNALGEQMATQAEAITALGAKATEILADFRAFRDAMTADRENLTAAGQAALDAANASIDELDVEVGEHATDEPPVEPLVEPTP